mgnify:CR=1 FL=1|tara:strand:+ start:897 stop:1082 length:186 start_codon:yes stop_codon:yes gene_type:complete
MANKKGKYKATSAFDVDAFDNYKGLGQDNHAKLSKGKAVELDFVPTELIELKMIAKIKGDK